MLYKPDRTRNLTEIDKDVLEKTKFFLTESSRAPDLNLFGTPRVTIWPLPAQTGDFRTSQDKLIAFCSTVGGNLFGFQRNNPKSQTDDFELLDRNKQIFSYLQDLTALDVPGFGSSLLGAFGTPAERNQILVEIFDYIRVSNLNDPNFSDDKMRVTRTPSGNDTRILRGLRPKQVAGAGPADRNRHGWPDLPGRRSVSAHRSSSYGLLHKGSADGDRWHDHGEIRCPMCS